MAIHSEGQPTNEPMINEKPKSVYEEMKITDKFTFPETELQNLGTV
jgi:hypothetical protein